MNDNATISASQLTRRFGSFTAVDHISIEVMPGEIFGFLGANGAGKTTAIRMLCGLLKPSGGEGHVAGFDIMKETAKIRTRIGYVAQKFSLYPDLTIRANLELYASLYGLDRARAKVRIAQTAAFLDLEHLLTRQTGDLPWGWQQRLSLACAILHEPRILFLDEPTGSVDPLSRRRFWELIQSTAAQGTTVFVTTHHMDEAEYCHRISLMVDGRIAALGTPRELKTRAGAHSLQEAFLTIVGQEGKS